MTAAVVVILVIRMLAGLNVLMALWGSISWFNWLVAGLCIGGAAGVIKEILDR